MTNEERALMELCAPELVLQSGLTGEANKHYSVAMRCIDKGWLVFVRDEEEVIPFPPPAMKIGRSIYRITPAGAAALTERN